MKWLLDQITVTVLLLLVSMTIFGLELPAGQKIILDGETYIVGKKLGIGGSADIYHLVSAANPKRRFVMRSPRFDMKNSEETAWYDEMKFRRSLSGLSLVSSINFSRSKWRWAPKVVVAQLNPHRQILEVEKALGWDKTHQEPIAIIPLAEESLMDFLESETFETKTFSEKVTLAVSAYSDLVPEMKNLISEKLVHGDIKPANILLDENGKAGLSDFEGIIRQGENSFFLTADFASPEHLVSKHPSFASDLYSFAKTLFCLLISKEHLDTLFDYKNPAEHHRKLLEIINQFERTISTNPAQYTPQTTELINFLKAAIEPDPIKRIANIKAYVPSFKDIEAPKDFKMQTYMKGQRLLIKSNALIDQTIAVIKSKLFKKRKAITIVPNFATTTSFVDDYMAKDITFIAEEFKTPSTPFSYDLNSKEIKHLTSQTLLPEEKTRLLAELRSESPEERAWASIRLILGGQSNPSIVDTFLINASLFLDIDILTQIYPIPNNDFQMTGRMLRLLYEHANENSTNLLGLLKVIDSTDHKELLKQKNVLDFASFPNPDIKRYFTQLFIKENFNLDRLTDALVRQSLTGDNSLLLEHLAVLKPYITSIQYQSIFNSSVKHGTYASEPNKEVILKLNRLPGTFRNFVPEKYPGYTLEEMMGVYRYKQPQAPMKSCHSFYKTAQ